MSYKEMTKRKKTQIPTINTFCHELKTAGPILSNVATLLSVPCRF